MTEPSSLHIKDVVNALRDELMEAAREREARGLPEIVTLQQLEIEANVVIKKSGQTEGQTNIYVIKLGQKADYAKEEVHRIKLTFKAIESDDDVRRFVNPKAIAIA